MQRVTAQGDLRPMADNREAMDDLRRILEARESLYRKADAVQNTSAQTVAAVVEQLAAEIRT